MNGATAGIGSASGNKGGTTRSGISAGTTITDDKKQTALTGKSAEQTVAATNRDVVSGKDSGAVAKDWNGQKLKEDVTAQAQITQAFSLMAAKEIGTYAGNKEKKAKDNAEAAGKAGDTVREAEFKVEAAKWAEGGAYRVALHAAAGGVAGGVGGALGAGASAAAAREIDKLQEGAQKYLEKAGMESDSAKAIAKGVAGATAAGIGAAAGGTAGAAIGMNVDVNNRQLHPGDYKVAKTLAAKSGGKYTEEEILNALRYSGVRDANGTLIIAEGAQEILISNADGKLVNVKSGTSIQDTYKVDGTISLRPDKTYPTVLVEDAPARPSNELVAYITANTGGVASPYVMTPSATVTTASSLPAAPDRTRRATTMVDGIAYFPLVANCPAAGCANGSPIAYAVPDDGTKVFGGHRQEDREGLEPSILYGEILRPM
jgi:filamentous hemagglutinin